MEIFFGIFGTSLGTFVFIIGLSLFAQVSQLKKDLEKLMLTLKESGVLADETTEEKKG